MKSQEDPSYRSKEAIRMTQHHSEPMLLELSEIIPL